MFEGLNVRRGAPLSEYTTLKLGGQADWLAFPSSRTEIASLLREAETYGLPVTVIGHGSNLLVRDGGIRGLVIRIGREMSDISVSEHTLQAGAGVHLAALAARAAEEGLSGLEFASGIPGTVGGAVCMNAGAYDGEMSFVVSSVEGLKRDGTPFSLQKDELGFSYRHSRLQEEMLIVTNVALSLTPGIPGTIREKMAELNRRRAEKQPLRDRSAGSAFKRPAGAYAAALIEQCGLKGFRIGGAMVSPKHAGFLVSDGGTAADFEKLIAHVRAVVEKQTGILLEPEIRILGEGQK